MSERINWIQVKNAILNTILAGRSLGDLSGVTRECVLKAVAEALVAAKAVRRGSPYPCAPSYHYYKNPEEVNAYLAVLKQTLLEENERVVLQSWVDGNHPYGPGAIAVQRYETGDIDFSYATLDDLRRHQVSDHHQPIEPTHSYSSGYTDTHGNYHASGTREGAGPMGH